MKKYSFFFIIIVLSIFSSTGLYANKPDSAYIFAYNKDRKEGRGGLCFAWSSDRKEWHSIGPEFAFVNSDYGRWGSQKRMFDPVLLQGKNGEWHAIWSLNNQDGAFAYTTSEDLINWKPQSYPLVAAGKNCLQTELSFQNDIYTVSWASINDNGTAFYAVDTKDFKTYSETRQITKSERNEQRQTISLLNKSQIGTIHKVPWLMIENLLAKVSLTNYRNELFAETTKDDHSRFPGLQPLEAAIIVNGENTKKISDKLLGIFFEDINYSADGGIYAELIQNRGFEYQPSDREGDQEWNSYKAWELKGKDAEFTIDTQNPIHENNRHYAILTVNKVGGGLMNRGFDGIALKANEKYDFSVFVRVLNGKSTNLKIRLTGDNGEIYGETTIKSISQKWKKYNSIITARADATSARLEILPQNEGKFALDMVSLFPQKTFKGRKNGLRADLAQVLADMKPRFVRFPGGCVAHGDGIDNIYHWKNTIGPLESRKPQRNLWGYHQTAGLGYLEYFQFCEDIGAEPVPIVAAGVPCQNSAHHGCAIGGQQGGIPLSEMNAYIQDILDLIEWANGDPRTSKWAKMRADAGHIKPFDLRYIGVGNEDLISDVFEERFEMIFKAIKEKHPEITVIGTAGPFSEGSDYDRGWAFANELAVPMLDEHYYQPPAWFIYNQDFYDKYDRNKSKVYLGEYAAHLPGRPNNMETALAEAIHLISCERNGDVVDMTSYAPLLAKENHTQWNPDLIYFNNTEVKPTVGYYVQKLFGENAGDDYISSIVDVQTHNDKVRKRIACSVVRDSKTKDIIIKLVNMLPVEVNTSLDVNALKISGIQAVRTTLTDKPDSKNSLPIESVINTDELERMQLPAYSFTVIKCKMQ
ncbi:alpha-L-arabinofuranosidase C-terminal domain-containing protein [Prevotella sp. 10(H)]|uniref:alpha-L-arabinofuranosidase C-terminal domain-containing protein n=1 Tax=Prevotella sp. 10(H) TaxID=1158294 RepID=UPI0004A75EFB|nr:alpha-L-arabinofuranosidase C-terminal domain-containing protein [Prevotella sp. 10(H)]